MLFSSLHPRRTNSRSTTEPKLQPEGCFSLRQGKSAFAKGHQTSTLLTSQHLPSAPLGVLSGLWDYLTRPADRSQIRAQSPDSGGSLALGMHINTLLSPEHQSPPAGGLSPCSRATQPDFQAALTFTECQACWGHPWLSQGRKMMCRLPAQGFPLTHSA